MFSALQTWLPWVSRWFGAVLFAVQMRIDTKKQEEHERNNWRERERQRIRESDDPGMEEEAPAACLHGQLKGRCIICVGGEEETDPSASREPAWGRRFCDDGSFDVVEP